MAAYVTYADVAIGGQGADVRVVERVHGTQGAADTRAGDVTGVSAYPGAVSDAADVGDLIDTGTGAIVEPAARSEAVAFAATWRERLHAAWRQYAAGGPHPASGRQGWWSSMPNGSTATTAVDRRMFHQAALGDVVASSAYAAGVEAAIRTAALERIESTLLGDGAAMYARVQAAGGIRASWSAAPVAAGGALHSDVVVAGTLLVRAADGAYRPIAGAAIPAGFNPDSSTLR